MNVDCVAPARRPRIVHAELNAPVPEARIPAGRVSAIDAKHVFAAKMGTEAVVPNAAATVAVAPSLR